MIQIIFWNFLNITQAETDRIMMQAMKNSTRWALLKELDKSDEDIISSFKI